MRILNILMETAIPCWMFPSKCDGKDAGVIYSCTNNGSVDADINPAGIAGILRNVEYDFDPELDPGFI